MFSLKLYMLPNLLSHIIGCDTESQKDNSDYASQIADLECDLASTNTTIHMLHAAANHTSLPTA
jgi:hypothetical protein